MKKRPHLFFLAAAVAVLLMPECEIRSQDLGSGRLLQSFDRLFQGDDPTEGFEFSLPLDLAVPSVVRFAGFAENQDMFHETGVRFWLIWGRAEGSHEEVRIFPEEPEFFMGFRLPPTDLAGNPVRVPMEFQSRIDYSPAWVKFTVEGLGCCDNFRLVGDLTIQPGPQLRLLRMGPADARISWTTNSVGYVLESASTLAAPLWSPVTNTVSVIAGDYSVTVETGAAQQVFRLRKP